MEKYVKLEMETVIFAVEDIIRTSPPMAGDENETGER